jgi:glycosyltransferase involved in cell wall biosynthesis
VNILLVNWQDLRNPMAGGAETHLHEIFERLARRGHRVRMLVSGWRGAPGRERVGALEVVRVGTRYSFGAHAPGAGRRLLREKSADLVVEALNKVPTFAPVWADRPVVLIVHHLFGTSAFQEAAVPLAAATWLLERPIPFAYRGVPCQAISESTADDLALRGLRRSDVEVIHPGVDLDFFRPAEPPRRTEHPTFVYVGRLRRYKRVDLVIRALAALGDDVPPARLLIAGRGEWEPRLRTLAARLGVLDRVDFLGFVAEEQKRELFRSAWANVFVSPKEGWGITNIEAAACGTPTVASDAPGLRESVAHERTGILVPHGDVEALAAALGALAQDRDRVDSLGRGALEFSRMFSWEAAADATEAHLEAVLAERSRPSQGVGAAAGGEAR